jgi:hypothetical protein
MHHVFALLLGAQPRASRSRVTDMTEGAAGLDNDPLGSDHDLPSTMYRTEVFYMGAMDYTLAY